MNDCPVEVLFLSISEARSIQKSSVVHRVSSEYSILEEPVV
jgi:hypothetical protein